MAILMALSSFAAATAVNAATGEFTIAEAENGSYTITKYTGTASDVVVPSEIDGKKITEISENAFANNKNLVSVTISKGIELIKTNAFSFCPNLTTVNASEGLKDASQHAFAETPFMDNLPEGLNYLGTLAYCYIGAPEDNTEITFKEGTTVIASMAFWYKGGITKISLPDTLTYIGGGAFSHCADIKELNMPSSVKEIGYEAFDGCGLISSVKIPEGVTVIERNTFSNCSNLSKVEFPSTLKTIDDAAFLGTAIKELNIPDSVEIIGEGSFTGTPFSNDESNWTDGILYYKNFALESKTDIATANIKEGTTYLAKSLFESRGSLTSVVMPDTVTAMGKEVFSFTKMLSKVEFSKNLKTIPPITFSYSGIKSIELPDGVEELSLGAFYDHVNLKTITIPASVKTIGYQAVGYFSNYGFEGRYGVTIYGESGTAAEKYAKSNNINFVVGKPAEQPTTPTDPTDPTDPVDPGESFAVYYKNTNGFAKPTAYYWKNGGSGPVPWPGVPMIDCGNGVYMVYVPVGNDMIIFSNSGNNKTLDLSIPGENQIYSDGNWSPYEVITPTEPTTEPTTVPATEPTTVPERKVLLGDVDLSGDVSIKDATIIQKQLVGLVEFSADGHKAADVYKDGVISIKNATAIQIYCVGMKSENSHCGEYVVL